MNKKIKSLNLLISDLYLNNKLKWYYRGTGNIYTRLNNSDILMQMYDCGGINVFCESYSPMCNNFEIYVPIECIEYYALRDIYMKGINSSCDKLLDSFLFVKIFGICAVLIIVTSLLLI